MKKKLVREKTTKFNADKLKELINKSNFNRSEISVIIGRGEHYIQNCLAKGVIGIPSLEKICRMLKCKPNSLIVVDEEPEKVVVAEPIPTVEQPKKIEAPTVELVNDDGEIMGYSIDLNVYPKKLKLTVKFNGIEIQHAWCHINGRKEVNLMQAISYAAHMCYKFNQQNDIEGGNK